jgi:hypothetical protein
MGLILRARRKGSKGTATLLPPAKYVRNLFA